MSSVFNALAHPDWAVLYQQHIDCQQQRLQQALERCGYEGVLIAAGRPGYFYGDDIARPFRAYAHFLSWLPLTGHPGCCLWLRPGHKPVLFYFIEQGFWHLPAEEPQGFWVSHFDVVCVSADTDIKKHLTGALAATAFIGEDQRQAADWDITAINPPSLLAVLDWHRAVKTPYEQACLVAASQCAVQGHRAAARAFAEGCSEFDIHLAYLQACRLLDEQLPYPNIIGLNEHGAVLHYQHRDRTPPSDSRSLLIDAGAAFQGYGADITRTYSRTHNPTYSPTYIPETGPFADLVEGVDQMQQGLVESLKTGLHYGDLHQLACLRLAELLQQLALVRMSPQQQLEKGVITRFFPHGLGHLLGLQVHDAGGHQADIEGALAPPPAAHPLLRLTRQLEAGMVFTVEPGVYFIDSLLQPLRQSKAGSQVNWPLVEQLKPFGGVRIEDNVLLLPDGSCNLTRQAFAAQQSQADSG